MESKIRDLTDAALVERLEALSAREIEATVELLLHLAEVDRRKLYLDAGYSSLFDYSTRKLRYSEPAAHRRISGARLIAQFPQLEADLLAREVSLSTLALVAGIVNQENSREVLSHIKGKSRREVEQFVAAYRPRKEAPREKVRPLAVTKAELKQPVTAGFFDARPPEKSPINSAFTGESTAVAPASPAEQRFELRFTVGTAVKQKLEEAKLCLSGKYPKGASLEQVFEQALELLLEKWSPKRRQARRKKRAQRHANKNVARMKSDKTESAVTNTRHVPKSLKDEVFERDGGCCTFVSKDGTRCRERHDLELHHNEPFGRNGTHSLENISLHCRRHNLYQAVQDYGGEPMQRYLGAGWEGVSERFNVKETSYFYGRRRPTVAAAAPRGL